MLERVKVFQDQPAAIQCRFGQALLAHAAQPQMSTRRHSFMDFLQRGNHRIGLGSADTEQDRVGVCAPRRLHDLAGRQIRAQMNRAQSGYGRASMAAASTPNPWCSFSGVASRTFAGGSEVP